MRFEEGAIPRLEISHPRKVMLDFDLISAGPSDINREIPSDFLELILTFDSGTPLKNGVSCSISLQVGTRDDDDIIRISGESNAKTLKPLIQFIKHGLCKE